MKTSFTLLTIICSLLFLFSCSDPDTVFEPNLDFDTVQNAYIDAPIFDANFLFLNRDQEMSIFLSEIEAISGFEEVRTYLSPPDSTFEEDVQISLRLVDFNDYRRDYDSCYSIGYEATIRCDLHFPDQNRDENFEKTGKAGSSSCYYGSVSVAGTQENAIKSTLSKIALYFHRGN